MQRLALIAALLLFAAAAARAVSSGYDARRKQLAEEAEAQRRKLNLDAKTLSAQYPTPEVTLSGEPARVACGDTASVKVTGKFAKDTSFLVSDDDVQVVEQKATAAGWQAKLKVGAAATPRNVSVHAIAPVSGAESSAQVLRIRGRYQLDLRFEDGWTAHFAPASADAGSGQLGGSLEWKKGADARTTQAQVDFSDAKLRIAWERSQEETDAQTAIGEKLQGLGGEKAMQDVMARMQACMEKAEPARTPCVQAAQKEAEKVGDDLRRKMEAVQAEAESKRPTAAWGCTDLQLTASNGALAGAATCAPKERRQRVTGTLKCLGPVSGE